MLVLVVVALEYALRRTRWGWRLRAVGSDEESARRLGVDVEPHRGPGLRRHVACSPSSGAIMLMAQLGIGDPAQGVGYTLSSITAVVLGGTSLLGGRGTFVGTLLGPADRAAAQRDHFLRLDQTWQYIFQGGLILVAASSTRSCARSAGAA